MMQNTEHTAAPLLVVTWAGCATLLARKGSTSFPILVAYTAFNYAGCVAIAGLHYWEQHRPFCGAGSRVPLANALRLWGCLAATGALLLVSCLRDVLRLPGIAVGADLSPDGQL